MEHLEQHGRPFTIRDAVGKDGTGGYVKEHFGDWLSKPLAELTNTDLVTKHRAITRAGHARACWSCWGDVAGAAGFG